MPPSLIAYDLIQQNVKTGSLTVTRHTISNEYGALTPSPVPTTESPTGTPVSGTPTPVASPSASASAS
jgi:hypothetical protein